MTSGNGAAHGSVHLRVERTRSGAFIETVHSGTGNVKDSVFFTPREVDQLIMQLATLTPFSRDYAYPGAFRESMYIPSGIERRAAEAAQRIRERALVPPPPDPMAGIMDAPEDPGGGAQDGEL